MKRYIRNSWNPLTGRDEPDDFEPVQKNTSSKSNEITDSYIQFDRTTFNVESRYKFEDGKLCRNSTIGWQQENRRPYRVAGNFNIYIDSFPRAGLPYSKYYIADKLTGTVYSAEISQGFINSRVFNQELVDWLKTQ